MATRASARTALRKSSLIFRDSELAGSDRVRERLRNASSSRHSDRYPSDDAHIASYEDPDSMNMPGLYGDEGAGAHGLSRVEFDFQGF